MEALFIVILNASCAKCGMNRINEKESNNGREEYNCIFSYFLHCQTDPEP